MNEYLNVIRNNYANFQGRARRREFWMFTLVNTVILLVLALLLALVTLTGSTSDSASLSPLVWVLGLVAVVYSLATVVPALAVSVRRLHDAGYTGWLELLEFVGLRIVVLVFHVMDSQPGSNKWGSNPKGVQAPTSAF